MPVTKPPASDQSLRNVPAFQAHLWQSMDCILGEGPLWDNGTLYWIDIDGKTIHHKRDGYLLGPSRALDVKPGCIVKGKDHQLVLATERGFASLDLKTGQLQRWANPEPSKPRNRFNDGKCDPRGRFVAGTYNLDGKPEGALYVLDRDRTVRELLRPVTCSNGLAWSSSGTEFYYIDTPTRCVRAFDYDLERGTVSRERVVITIPEKLGYPDGMSIDSDGNLWIALWDGWAVECWDPRTGNRLARIDVPAARVTSCVFGGAELRTLFITTARVGLDAKALAKQRMAGSIFAARPGVAGVPAVNFSG